MAQMPYSPMHQVPLATEADQRRMAEKLAKHGKPKVEVNATNEHAGLGQPVIAADHSACPVSEMSVGPDRGAKLKWQKVNDWYAITECGRYRCHKYIPDEVRLGEHNETPLYQLEYRVGDVWFYRLGPPYSDKKEAAAAAQKHWEQQK